MGKCSVGSKKTKVVMAEEGDTVEEDVAAEQTSSFCIPNDMALRLARLGIELEERFGGPRDIEFAIVKVTFTQYSIMLYLEDLKEETYLFKDTIYLLQSRPITSLQAWTDRDLLREFDVGITSEIDVSTKGNVG